MDLGVANMNSDVKECLILIMNCVNEIYCCLPECNSVLINDNLSKLKELLK